MTELVTIEKHNALTLFTTENGCDPLLSEIERLKSEFVADVSTKKGRDAVASFAHSIARSKTYLDGIGKALVDDLKKQPKLVDAERKRIRDTLDAWRDEVRKPLTDLEDAEKAVLIKLSDLQDSCFEHSSDAIIALEQALAIDTDFAIIDKNKLESAKDSCVLSITDKIELLQRAEAQQAEIERLRKEAEAAAQAERDRKIAEQAAEQARAAAEAAAKAAAKAEAERAERERLAAKAEAERAERERLAAIAAAEKAKRDADAAIARAELEKQMEIDRVKAEAERAEYERLKAAQEQERIERERAANIEHKRSINQAIVSALVAAGLSSEDAKKVVTLASKGHAANLMIKY